MIDLSFQKGSRYETRIGLSNNALSSCRGFRDNEPTLSRDGSNIRSSGAEEGKHESHNAYANDVVMH